jgi:hypothetical protein
MTPKEPTIPGWTPEQVALGLRWVDAWKRAAVELEAVRRRELRSLDSRRAIALLCGSPAPGVAAPPLRETSGLVEQQRWFRRAARNP